METAAFTAQARAHSGSARHTWLRAAPFALRRAQRAPTDAAHLLGVRRLELAELEPELGRVLHRAEQLPLAH